MLKVTDQKSLVKLKSEWLELFWCDKCQKSKWYQVKMEDRNQIATHEARTYYVSFASEELLQQLRTIVLPGQRNIIRKSACTNINQVNCEANNFEINRS